MVISFTFCIIYYWLHQPTLTKKFSVLGSSLFGLFNEHGPFKVKSDNTLEPRSTTWALTHNIIYIDNPVGTGMSLSLIIIISHKTIFN